MYAEWTGWIRPKMQNVAGNQSVQKGFYFHYRRHQTYIKYDMKMFNSNLNSNLNYNFNYNFTCHNMRSNALDLAPYP